MVTTVPEAARQLDIPVTTLGHWLDGHTIGGTFCEPVSRPEQVSVSSISWGEMGRPVRSRRPTASMSPRFSPL